MRFSYSWFRKCSANTQYQRHCFSSWQEGCHVGWYTEWCCVPCCLWVRSAADWRGCYEWAVWPWIDSTDRCLPLFLLTWFQQGDELWRWNVVNICRVLLCGQSVWGIHFWVVRKRSGWRWCVICALSWQLFRSVPSNGHKLLQYYYNHIKNKVK